MAAQREAMSPALTMAVVRWRESGLVWQHVDFARVFREGDAVVGRHVAGVVVEAAGHGVVLGQAIDALRGDGAPGCWAARAGDGRPRRHRPKPMSALPALVPDPSLVEQTASA
jgi:hypothetical protein